MDIRPPRRRPMGVSFWEWHFEPRWDRLVWWWQGKCLSCGMKRPQHKFSCSTIK